VAAEEKADEEDKSAEEERVVASSDFLRIPQPSSADTAEVAKFRVLEENNLVLIQVPADGNCMFVSILIAFICRLAVEENDWVVPTGAGLLLDIFKSYFSVKSIALYIRDMLFTFSNRYEGTPS
jgi:hypothetical protein